MDTSEVIARLDELGTEKDRLFDSLKRSLALKDWIPDVFEGPGRVTHTILGSLSKGFRFRLYKACGTTFECPVKDVPVGVCRMIPKYEQGDVVWVESRKA